jgi:hypothetical protein
MAAFQLAKNRVKFFNFDKFDVSKIQLAPELLEKLNFQATFFLVNKKSKATFFLGNEKYLNCYQKNKKLQIKIIVHDSFYFAV